VRYTANHKDPNNNNNNNSSDSALPTLKARTSQPRAIPWVCTQLAHHCR
jgi:hypothetical protein